MRGLRRFFILILPLVVVACAGGAPKVGRSVVSTSSLPPMRWDHRPEAANWTRAALAAMADHGAALTASTPADIAAWCPAYASNPAPERQAFWIGLLSALAKHESTWNPQAVGGGGRWFGLVQIAPGTARNYGCRESSVAGLKRARRTFPARFASWRIPSRATGWLPPVGAAWRQIGGRSMWRSSAPTWPTGPAPNPIAARPHGGHRPGAGAMPPAFA